MKVSSLKPRILCATYFSYDLGINVVTPHWGGLGIEYLSLRRGGGVVSIYCPRLLKKILRRLKR